MVIESGQAVLRRLVEPLGHRFELRLQRLKARRNTLPVGMIDSKHVQVRNDGIVSSMSIPAGILDARGVV